jgi:hypothetical protein
MHRGRSRYVKVRNEDGVSVTTKVVTKQLRYIPITPRLKRLFLSEETAKQMRWHHEGKHESEDPDIMSHPADSEAWQTLDRFDPDLQGTQGVSVLVCRWMVSNLTAPIVIRTLADQSS